MTINHYYRQVWVPKGVDPDIFETTLANEVESKASVAFGKALHDRENLTADDTAALLYHLEMQRIRVPSYADLAKDALTSMMLNKLEPSVAAQVISGKLKMDVRESFRFDAMRGASGVLVRYYQNMNWQIGVAEEGSTLITSDNPVTFFNVNYPPPHVPGLGRLGTVVMFPIDRTHLLTLTHKGFDGDSANASDMIPEPELFDGAIEVTYKPIIPRDKIQAFNEINLHLSKRLTVASSKDALEKTTGKVLKG